MSSERRDITRTIVALLSLLGFALSLYLAYVYSSASQIAFCEAGSGCDAVRESAYATLLRVPVPVWGVVGYGLMLLVAAAPMAKRKRWLYLYVLASVALSFSAYLTYVELFVIEALCPFCVASASLALAIFIALVVGRPKRAPLTSSAMAVVTVAALVIVSFGAYVAQSTSTELVGSDSPQVKLARHLAATGATMYGTYWCPHCQKQKRLFGDAFRYVPYVDCDPAAPRNSDPAECRSKGITRYPTWIIGGKRYIGVKSLSELAYLSGFDGWRRSSEGVPR